MAPAGGWPQLKAAVHNGADAVYFGLSTFSARARATNFDPGAELDEVISYLREHEVKGYVALNTLAFDKELDEIERLLRRCSEAGVDAVIVQDVGVMALAREVAPELPIHASTQQSISSADGAEFARERGATTAPRLPWCSKQLKFCTVKPRQGAPGPDSDTTLVGSGLDLALAMGSAHFFPEDGSAGADT